MTRPNTSTLQVIGTVAVIYAVAISLFLALQSVKEELMKKCVTLHPSKNVIIRRCEVVKP